jgi:hypothetical protein
MSPKRHLISLFAALVMGALLPSPCPAADAPVMVTRRAAEGYLAVKDAAAVRDGGEVRYDFAEFRQMAGEGPYPLKQLESYQPRRTPVPPKAGPEVKLRIRRDYNDVLPQEDRTAQTEKEIARDIDGALLSWNHDLSKDSTTLDIRGAILMPVAWRSSHPDAFLTDWGMVPSISMHKTTTDGDPATEVDSLIYRVGGWAGLATGGVSYYQKLSGWVTLGTDTDHGKQVFAGEFDWETTLHLGKNFGIGSYHSLLERPNADAENETYLGYLLTAALHAEAGEIQDPGSSNILPGSFFRVGPRVKLIIDPLFHKTLTASVEYTRLFDIDGDSPEPEYLRAALIWSPNEGKQWSVRLEYEKGGLDLTQERVDQITAGLQVRF